MVETGDNREGFLFEELDFAVSEIKLMKNVILKGFATNTTCLSGQAPEPDQILKIVELTEKYLGEEGIASPGNSGALYLLDDGRLPQFRGELRIGEAILLGNETVSYKKLPFLREDAVNIIAEVLEVRRKGYDKIQLVVALGIADVGKGSLKPDIEGLKEVRRSSDHTVFIVEEGKEEKVFDILKKSDFTLTLKPDYFALMQAFLSPNVYRVYLREAEKPGHLTETGLKR